MLPSPQCCVSDFDFDLPDELIAQQAAPRGTSRLLVLDRAIRARRTRERGASWGSSCEPGDLLVVNDTRVFPARLLGQRVPSGGAVECLLLSLPAAASGGGGRMRRADASGPEAEARRASCGSTERPAR